ncbi:hypothetical protein K3G39_01230 [Pontibacter sp. HSC-14F20]|uniref:hypothetical protein n=1 Tax=Pontibacter sp. HSC-14F20 TaxID=2864136 RepID=UPI001C734E54|nr:hypothetical protein [Pontibacter sp. HSC-14F20]MBX0331852.1 hypothetical protein [Pontibacter sp. HSC-14F20]
MKKTYRHYLNGLGQRYCTLRYLDERQMLSIIWKGTATQEHIDEVEKGMLEMIRQYPCRSIINDVQDFFEAPTTYLAYLTWTEWDKKVRDTSEVSCIAHVLHPEAPMPESRKESSDSPEVRFFTHKMDAVEWLNNQNLN